MTADQLLARPQGARVLELAAAWKISGGASTVRLKNRMQAGTVFVGDHAMDQAKHYFSTEAARDAWLLTGARQVSAPIQAEAMRLANDGRAYVTSADLSASFGCKTTLAIGAMKRLAEHGLLIRLHVGHRSFFFLTEAAALAYPVEALERAAKAAMLEQRRKPLKPGAEFAVAKARAKGKPEARPVLVGEVIGMDTVPVQRAETPRPRFAPEPGYVGPFSSVGLGRDVRTGEKWGQA